jgi:uncharacterized membrane protein
MTARNLPRWERAVRVLLGVAALAAAFIWLGSPERWCVAAVAVIMIVTGLRGHCPLCAIAGRGRR